MELKELRKPATQLEMAQILQDLEACNRLFEGTLVEDIDAFKRMVFELNGYRDAKLSKPD
jgi:hypothetical protein